MAPVGGVIQARQYAKVRMIFALCQQVAPMYGVCIIKDRTYAVFCDG
jgi:hypothetical protein